MPCCVWIVALLVPRAAMVAIFLLTDWFAQAYDTLVWPILGFLFMPYTTLAYMAAQVKGGGVEDGWLILVIVAVVIDVGNWGGSGHAAQRRHN